LLATVLQTSGLSRNALADRLAGNAAFSRITRIEIDQLIGHLIATTVLEVVDGSVTFGDLGERRFGYRQFMQLASVFQGTESVTVQAAQREVGTLDRWFIDEMIARDRSTFLLNGRAWSVVGWPDFGSVLEVTSASSAEAPLFFGSGLVLSHAVMQSVRGILASAEPLETLLLGRTSVSTSVTEQITAMRKASEAQRLDRPANPLISDGVNAQLFTYAGLRANRLVNDLVFDPFAVKTTLTNTAVKFRARDLSAQTLLERFAALLNCDLQAEVSTLPTHGAANTKFYELLDLAAQRKFSHERAYDVDGAQRTFANGIRIGLS